MNLNKRLQFSENEHTRLQSENEKLKRSLSETELTIKKFNDEVEILMSKNKTLEKVIINQEEKTRDTENTLSTTRNNLEIKNNEIKINNDTLKSKDIEINSLKDKIEDANKLIENNKQMIGWLNTQVSEQKFSKYKPSHASSFVSTQNVSAINATPKSMFNQQSPFKSLGNTSKHGSPGKDSVSNYAHLNNSNSRNSNNLNNLNNHFNNSNPRQSYSHSRINPRDNNTAKEVEELKSSLNRITSSINKSVDRNGENNENLNVYAQDTREGTGMMLGGLKEKIQREKEERKCDVPIPMKYKK